MARGFAVVTVVGLALGAVAAPAPVVVVAAGPGPSAGQSDSDSGGDLGVLYADGKVTWFGHERKKKSDLLAKTRPAKEEAVPTCSPGHQSYGSNVLYIDGDVTWYPNKKKSGEPATAEPSPGGHEPSGQGVLYIDGRVDWCAFNLGPKKKCGEDTPWFVCE